MACAFCDNLSREKPQAPWDRILFDSGNFVICPTKGSLVPGWLLVIAKSHLLCSGALGTEFFPELEATILRAQDMVTSHFGEATIFEHGPCASGTALGCGIDHLHIHVVPLSFSLKEAARRSFPAIEWSPLRSLLDTTQLFDSQQGYAAVQEPGDHLYYCRPPRNVRQFFRRVIAAQEHVPDEFDYSIFPYPSNALRTVEALSTAVFAEQ